jgi:hypothetical protein
MVHQQGEVCSSFGGKELKTYYIDTVLVTFKFHQLIIVNLKLLIMDT